MDAIQNDGMERLKNADANPQLIACNLTLGFAWLILTSVFLSRHDGFCNKYWEQVDGNGIYYGEDMEQYWPNMGGRPKTEIWLITYVALHTTQLVITLVMSGLHLSGFLGDKPELTNLLNKVVVVARFFVGFTVLCWILVGTIWVWGPDTIPRECKRGDLGSNSYYTFLYVILVLTMLAWPCACCAMVAMVPVTFAIGEFSTELSKA